MREASVSDDPPKSIYGCAECGKGFHVNCFTAFHGQEALSSKKEVLGKLVAAVVMDKPKFCDCVSKNISSNYNITLYCEDIIRKKTVIIKIIITFCYTHSLKSPYAPYTFHLPLGKLP